MQGSSLITTLLVLVVLSTICIAFMQSMSIERSVARSTKNSFQAELAAQAAVANAISRLSEANPTFPISAYEELQVGLNGATITAPYLTFVKPAADWISVSERRYLVSSPSNNVPPTSTGTNTVDMNFASPDKPLGWIGLATSSGSRRAVPAEWIVLSNAAGVPVARYAFWVDDESARIDLSTAGSVDSTPQKGHVREAGSESSEISIHGLFNTAQDVERFITARDASDVQPSGLLGFMQMAAQANAAWKVGFDSLRASIGTGGTPNEQGAFGIRKIDLNEWALTDSQFGTPAARNDLAQKVISLGDFINQADPDFGTRFFAGATGDDAREYCIKLAANIQDFIDPDSQPTVIRNNLGGWQEPPTFGSIGEGAPVLPPAAFGKEIVPSVGEYMGYYYNDAGALRIDHVFEVWNLHDKPVDLAALGTARILVAERNDVTPRTGSDAPDPDLPGEPGNPPLELTLPSSGQLPAGSYSLLTTLPGGSTHDSQWVVGSPNRIRLPRNEPTYAYGSDGLYMRGDELATSADVDTEIVIANQFGYLDIQARVAQQGPVNLRATDPARYIASQPFGNDPPGSGNNASRRYPLDSGDPRSLTEVFPVYSESGGSPSVVAWRRNTANSQGATRLGAESHAGTSGILPSNNGSDPSAFVPEPIPSPDMAAAQDAVSVIRNDEMSTEGELSFVFDPAVPGSGYENPNVRKRGGFRTLSIGSTLGEATGPARLSQVGQTNRASRLLELFNVTATQTNQRLLLNSALRNPDNLPWRALLEQLKTQTNANHIPEFASFRDPDFPNVGAGVNADRLIDALENVARGTPSTPGRPFLLVGQLADLPVLNTGSTLMTNSASGAPVDITPSSDNQNLTDRGREEIFRRLAGLVALKGTRFRIYAIGQALQALPGGAVKVTATSNLLTLCDIENDYPADPLDDLDMPDLLNNNRATRSEVLTIFQSTQ